MKTLALILLAVLSWTAPQTWISGEPIDWAAVADMTYLPCYSSTPSGPFTDLPQTDLLSADAPDPAPGGTLWYSCRVMYCPEFLCGPPSAYAPPVSLTVESTESAPTKKGYGKGGKKR